MTRKIRSFYSAVKQRFSPWKRRGRPNLSGTAHLSEIDKLRIANAQLAKSNAELIQDYDAQVAYSRFLVAKAQELEYDAMLRRVELMGALA